MPTVVRPWLGLLGLLAVGLLLGMTKAEAMQELEPGAFAPAPIDLNIAIVTNSVSIGDLAFEPTGPISDGDATMNFTTFGYGRTLGIAGRSASVSGGVPVVWGHLQGRLLGEPVEATRFGPGDPRVRIAINLYGVPATKPQSFGTLRLRRVVGASLTVSVPVGQYSSDRLVNISGHRWAFKPELGFVNMFGRWTLEVAGGAWLFTQNDEFYRGSVRSQDPIGSFQWHLHYALGARTAVSGNMNFYVGGKTTVNGQLNEDLQRNARVGATLSRSLAGARTLRIAVSHGAVTTVGGAFTSLSVAFQQVWGGG
jgi:hypothetical protein